MPHTRATRTVDEDVLGLGGLGEALRQLGTDLETARTGRRKKKFQKNIREAQAKVKVVPTRGEIEKAIGDEGFTFDTDEERESAIDKALELNEQQRDKAERTVGDISLSFLRETDPTAAATKELAARLKQQADESKAAQREALETIKAGFKKTAAGKIAGAKVTEAEVGRVFTAEEKIKRAAEAQDLELLKQEGRTRLLDANLLFKRENLAARVKLQEAKLKNAGDDKEKLSDISIRNFSLGQTAFQRLLKLAKKIKEKESLLGPIVGTAGAKSPWAIEAQKLQGEINAVRQFVGKYIEGGVLRKEDEEKYKTILATLSDKPVVALAKLGIVASLLRDKYNNDITTFEALNFNIGTLRDTLTGVEEDLKFTIDEAGQIGIVKKKPKPTVRKRPTDAELEAMTDEQIDALFEQGVLK